MLRPFCSSFKPIVEPLTPAKAYDTVRTMSPTFSGPDGSLMPKVWHAFGREGVEIAGLPIDCRSSANSTSPVKRITAQIWSADSDRV